VRGRKLVRAPRGRRRTRVMCRRSRAERSGDGQQIVVAETWLDERQTHRQTARVHKAGQVDARHVQNAPEGVEGVRAGCYQARPGFAFRAGREHRVAVRGDSVEGGAAARRRVVRRAQLGAAEAIEVLDPATKRLCNAAPCKRCSARNKPRWVRARRVRQRFAAATRRPHRCRG